MDVINGIGDIPPHLHDGVVTIGNFDGVHRGHRQLIKRLLDEARREKRRALVITFNPHPKMILRPELQPFYLITTLEEKLGLLEEAGVDAAIVISFTREYAGQTAEEFIRRVLWEGLHIRKIVIGHDYTFGKGKEGNEAFLTAFGRKLGFAVDVINAVEVGETVISSTVIRDAVLGGEVRTAAALLGRPYNLRGPVVVGKRRGTGIGFPTANIEPEKVLIPGGGVYAATVRLKGQRYPAVANIGTNPTFNNLQLSVEVHILDFQGDIYGETLDIAFIERIRDEIRFPGPEALALQIRKDIERARLLLTTAS